MGVHLEILVADTSVKPWRIQRQFEMVQNYKDFEQFGMTPGKSPLPLKETPAGVLKVETDGYHSRLQYVTVEEIRSLRLPCGASSINIEYLKSIRELHPDWAVLFHWF